MQTELITIVGTVIIGTIIFSGLVVFIVVFLFHYKKKQLLYLQEKAALKAQYEQEILQSQLEVQNQTLQNISHELHDNIGQLLTVVKINVELISIYTENKNFDLIEKHTILINSTINQIIDEIRNLSKGLDGHSVQEFGLIQTTGHELQRIKKTNQFETELIVEGIPYKLDFKREILLYRIIQEVLNNAMKHSEATQLAVFFGYTSEMFEVIIQDNGKGFDIKAVLNRKDINKSGVGLKSIQNRISLINGICKIDSVINKGTTYILNIPFAQN